MAYASYIIFAAAAALSHADHWEPMVAFVCNRGAMYYSEEGWVPDQSTDCLASPKDILSYCQKRFPAVNVTNIVEGSAEVEIAGWCPKGKALCTAADVFAVRPYRCLVGAFQSDSLTVPTQCKFDYVRNSEKCRPYSWWGDVARKECMGVHGMAIQSFAMLLPCDTDLFNGVEFVCCPKSTEPVAAAAEPAAAKPVITVKASKGSSQLESSAPKKEESAVLLDKYIKMSVEDGNVNEHEAFGLTKHAVQEDTESKIQKVMKEWAAAKNRILELQSVDAKQAETLNKEVTLRFQKEYFALQSQGEASMQQVESVHQQHVYSILNEKKRVAVEALIRKVDSGAEPAAVLKYLQRYIALEEKDAEQCLRHYLNQRDRYPADVDNLRQDTVDHLKLISTRIRQGIDLVSGYPDQKLSEEIQKSVNDWLKKSFLDIDNVVKQMSSDEPSSASSKTEEPVTRFGAITNGKSLPPAKPVVSKVVEKVLPSKSKGGDSKGFGKPQLSNKELTAETAWAVSEPEAVPKQASSYRRNEVVTKEKDSTSKGMSKESSEELPIMQLTVDQIEKAYADERQQHQDAKEKQPTAEAAPKDWLAIDDDYDDVREDEHVYLSKDAKGHAAHAMKAGNFVAEQDIALKDGVAQKASLTAGTAVAIAGGVIVALAIVVGAVIVVRRKQDARSSRRASYIEVAMDMSPEELHVMQMQMNGYENPTYRFLEMQQTAPQHKA